MRNPTMRSWAMRCALLLALPAASSAYAQSKPAPKPADATAKPAAPAAQPAAEKDSLIGEWKIFSIENGRMEAAGVLAISSSSRGAVGGAVSGQMKFKSGETCAITSLLFSALTGMYPDGSRIQTFPMAGLMRGELKCPEGKSGLLEALIEEKDKTIFRAAGRLAWIKDSKVDRIDFISLAR